MAKIKIKKRVSLDFIGDEFKDAYLVFYGMSFAEYEDYINKQTSSTGDLVKTELAAIKLIKTELKNRFVEGKYPNEKGELENVTPDEIKDFDPNTLYKCFNYVTGRELPPKV